MKTTLKKNLPKAHLRSVIDEKVQVNEDDRTVELTWSTGFKGLRSGWDGQYYEELSMDSTSVDMSRLEAGAPLLNSHRSHDLDSVIGVVEKAWIENGEGKAIVRFASDEESDKIFKKVQEKILRNVSVGYQVRKYENVSQKGDEVPTYRATNWQPHEISIVPIGFDPTAQVRADEIQTEVEIEEINTNEGESEDAPTITIKESEQMTDEQKRALELAARQAEKTRQVEIRNAVRVAKLDESFAQELIEKDITIDEARASIFEKMATSQPAPKETSIKVEVSVDEGDKKRSALTESLLSRVDSNNFAVTEQSKQFHGKRVLRALEEIFPRGAMESDAQYAIRAMSSSDLPLLLANVAGKSLQKRYELAPKTYSKWTKTATLSDYKEHSQYRMGDFASLLEKQENGEYKHASVGEEKETVKLKDYGRMYEFTARMLINDDLEALKTLVSESGIAASRLENKLCYDVLSANATMGDGTAIFHANHSNLGTGAVISETTIGAMWTAMRKQKSQGGLDTLNLSPSLFVCGPSQEVAARKFFSSIAPNQTSNVNIFQNSVEIIVDAEISGNEYYMLASPSQIDTVTLFKLQGQESPQVASRVKFENDALQLKVGHTVAAKAIDYRGMQKNPGQA